MTGIIFLKALCVGEGLDVLGLLGSGRKRCRVMSEMCIDIGCFRSCTARNLVTILGRT